MGKYERKLEWYEWLLIGLAALGATCVVKTIIEILTGTQ